jgi:hypothetical protein
MRWIYWEGHFRFGPENARGARHGRLIPPAELPALVEEDKAERKNQEEKAQRERKESAGEVAEGLSDNPTIHLENPHGATIPSFQTEGASQACPTDQTAVLVAIRAALFQPVTKKKCLSRQRSNRLCESVPLTQLRQFGGR